jgi:hypothetical protein
METNWLQEASVIDQLMILHHVFYLKVLDADHLVFVVQLFGQLV